MESNTVSKTSWEDRAVRAERIKVFSHFNPFIPLDLISHFEYSIKHYSPAHETIPARVFAFLE